jgi:hypothetical protein
MIYASEALQYMAAVLNDYERKALHLEAENIRLKETLIYVAKIAHAGGLSNMSEGDALNAIRKATVDYWTAKHVAIHNDYVQLPKGGHF